MYIYLHVGTYLGSYPGSMLFLPKHSSSWLGLPTYSTDVVIRFDLSFNGRHRCMYSQVAEHIPT